MTGITILLSVIAAILFYRFVERRHKIALLKVLGALVLAGCLAVGALIAADAANSRKDAALLASVQPGVAGITDSTVSVIFCNQVDGELIRYQVELNGYRRGRSTPQPIARAVPGDISAPTAPTRLSSDFVIPQGSCELLTWSSRYTPFDSVSATMSAVEFADGRRAGFFRTF